ncbi:MAG TPA: FAD-dependent thymidylate synthase [Terriglobales bacterium]|nr:FAD-dependent thymidylate synthase [Terriglobales bacterium]
MSEPVIAIDSTNGNQAAAPGSPEVYVIYGAEPEVQAYAMAKYSRSALSLKESLQEVSQHKAEKFLNTFYFQYGHRSIADLAHVALAIERLSILAAIAVVDQQRWDGQERSTRYQDFKKSGYFVPDFADDEQASELYQTSMHELFLEYEVLSERMFRYLKQITPQPPDMKPEAYERTLRARAFDISRYLLPLGTNTSLGEIVNARTLESQISHLRSATHKEVRHLGELLKRAASSPAYNVAGNGLGELVSAIRAVSPELGVRAEEQLLREIRVAPTLVKYADPNPYEIETRRELRQCAQELMGGRPVHPSPSVDLLEAEPLEVELATTLIYEHSHYPYRQIRSVIEESGERARRAIIDLGLRHRGSHDEMLRPFCAGQPFRFDILMDVGGFRDLHRHRRCIQILQDFTTRHGYDTPEEVNAAELSDHYHAVIERAASAVERLRQAPGEEAGENAQYAIPLAFRKRSLFKMDFSEVVYICELRTTPTGHRSYRNVAYAMFEAVAKKYPGLAKSFRVHDVHEPVDLLKR